MKVLLTDQNHSEHREMDLVRQRANEIKPTLVKELLFAKFITCSSFMVISANSV